MSNVTPIGMPLPMNSIEGMPKGAPELLHRMSILAHKRNEIIYSISVEEEHLKVTQHRFEKARALLGPIDTKIAEAQKELLDAIATQSKFQEE